MDECPTILKFMGRDVRELSREELIAAVAALGREIEMHRNMHAGTLQIMEVMIRPKPPSPPAPSPPAPMHVRPKWPF